jgi:hypothetical protein
VASQAGLSFMDLVNLYDSATGLMPRPVKGSQNSPQLFLILQIYFNTVLRFTPKFSQLSLKVLLHPSYFKDTQIRRAISGLRVRGVKLRGDNRKVA